MVTHAVGVIVRWFVGVCVQLCVCDGVGDRVVGMSNVLLELIGRGAWCPSWEDGQLLVCVYLAHRQGSKDLRWIGTNEPVDVCP